MLPRAHNIVGRWCPSAGATGFRLFDRVGSNHGTLTNMDAATDWVPSGGKLALDFDGSNDHVLFVDPPARFWTLPFSVSLWFLTRSTTTSQQVFALGNSTDTDQFFLVTLRGDLSGDPIHAVMRGNDPTSNTAAIYTGYTTNRWTHVVAVFARTNYRTIFVDGIEGTPDTTSYTVEPLNRMSFGALVRTTTSGYFNGQLDDVTIFNAALNQNDARSIYRLGRGYGVYPDFDFDDANIIAPAFRPYWASRRSQLIGGGI